MTHQKNLQLCPDSNSDLKWSKIDLLSIFDGRLAELWNELVKNGELIGKAENQGKFKILIYTLCQKSHFCPKIQFGKEFYPIINFDPNIEI